MKQFCCITIIIMYLISLSLSARAGERGLQVAIKELGAENRIGKQWLVIIAINNYREWPSLQYPVSDAKAIRKVLCDRYYIDTVVELYDQEATRAQMARLFVDLQNDVGINDSILIYYAGHGYLDRNSNTGFLIPYDAGKNEFEQKNWFPNASVRGYIANIRSTHLCLMMDSCFSGDIIEAQRGKPDTIDSDYFKKAYARTSRQVLTSGASETVPDRSEFALGMKAALVKNDRSYCDPLMLYEEIRLGMSQTTPLFGNLRSAGHQEGASFILFLKQEQKNGNADEEPSVEIPVERPVEENKEPDTGAVENRQKQPDAPKGMVVVETGSFRMGTKEGAAMERPVHDVTVRPFFMAAFEITFAEFDEFCDKTGRNKPQDRGWGRGMRPVIFVSWYDAIDYCNWKSAQEGLTPAYLRYGNAVRWIRSANGYRLPTEAEWEYAARGGIHAQGMKFAGSGRASSVAWFKENASKKTHPVGEKRANELGLHDMSGNVWEWCWDYFSDNFYADSPVDDPAGPDGGTDRVLRGGSWYNGETHLRSTARGNGKPGKGDDFFGFRIVRNAD